MTLPMLAKNYQFYVRQQQFKKIYAAMDIAIQKTQIDMGEGVKCFTPSNQDDYIANQADRAECLWFFEEFSKNLIALKTCHGEALKQGCLTESYRGEMVYAEVQGGEDKEAAKDFFNNMCSGFSSGFLEKRATVILLNSGFIIVPYTWFAGNDWANLENKTEYGSPYFLVDINGAKGPNKWGFDVMVFVLQKDKKYDSVFKLKPSKACHPIETGGIYTTDFFEYLYGQNAELQ